MMSSKANSFLLDRIAYLKTCCIPIQGDMDITEWTKWLIRPNAISQNVLIGHSPAITNAYTQKSP